MDTSLPGNFSAEFAALTPNQQSRVVEFMRQVKSTPSTPVLSKEERRQAILSLVGSISREDLQILTSVIETDCERIDADGW